MSFCKTNTIINEGDYAIVYLSYNQLYPIKVSKNSTHSTKYGTVKHADIIGKPYGSKFKCSKGCVYILAGNPELWTLCLPHRTQILYTPDISFIILQLDLKPNSVVIESGTGSGSLSHALIRSVYPNGHLHTFEFHEKRYETAIEEFKDHGLSEFVTVYHQDVCNNGFGLVNTADAIFLDLPNPWKSLPYAKTAMKLEGGRICCFSPCIEQVQKTTEELTRLNFVDVQTFENLRRIYCIKKHALNDFDFSSNNSEKKSEDVSQKRIKKKESDSDDDNDNNNGNDNEPKTDAQYCSKAINSQPGHTGYLTFATLLCQL